MPHGALVQLGDVLDRDQAAVADDPDPVGDVLHLREHVGRQEHRAPVGRGLAQELVEGLLHQRVEPGGRLVEHEQFGPVRERLDEPDLLLVAA